MAAAASYPFTSALVTGASSGIGEELTRQLTAAGVPVVVVARREDRLLALADELPGVEVLVADLNGRRGQDAVCARIGDVDRPIDLVVNNAGFGTSGPFHETDPDRLDEEVGLNVGALTRLSHAALATMVPRRRGWLLNVASVAAYQPGPHLAVYAATKAYVLSLSESLHEEVKGDGRHGHRAVSGPDPHRVPGRQQHRALPVVVPRVRVVRRGRRRTRRAGGDGQGPGRDRSGALYKTVTWVGGVTPAGPSGSPAGSCRGRESGTACLGPHGPSGVIDVAVLLELVDRWWASMRRTVPLRDA